jgi:hypothetical protein
MREITLCGETEKNHDLATADTLFLYHKSYNTIFSLIYVDNTIVASSSDHVRT